jgi:hypothetical protein
MRLTEIQLKRIIRNIILTEGMMLPEQLGDNLKIQIVDGNYDFVAGNYNPGKTFEVNLLKADQHGETEIDVEVGTVSAMYSHFCGGYSVLISYSDINNYGPLLYDIALEVAGDRGLMPDRSQVSGEAEDVWSYYLNRRYDIAAEPIKDINCDNPREFMPGGKEKFGDYDWANWIYYQTQGTPMTDRLLKLNKITFKG